MKKTPENAVELYVVPLSSFKSAKRAKKNLGLTEMPTYELVLPAMLAEDEKDDQLRKELLAFDKKFPHVLIDIKS